VNEVWTEEQRLRASLKGAEDRVKELQALCREAAAEMPVFCQGYYERWHIMPDTECHDCIDRAELSKRLREAGGDDGQG